MIKRGSKVVIKKPLKVVRVVKYADPKIVTVKVRFTDSMGFSMIQEIDLPRSMVKEYKPEKKEE